MRPLRVCVATTFYPPYHLGGDAVFVHRCVESLVERGHHVDVIHSIDAYRIGRGRQRRLPVTHPPGVRMFGLETNSPTLSALRVHQTGRPGPYEEVLRETLDSEPYDVIHFHNISLLGAPAILRRGRGVKLLTAHDYWLICPTHVLYRNRREACTQRTCLSCTLRSRRPPQLWREASGLVGGLQEIDRLLVPSQFSKHIHLEAGITAPIEVVGPPLPIPAQDTLTAPVDTDRSRFVFVGRLEPLKGLQDAIPIFRDRPDLELVVVGDGGMRDELERQSAGAQNIRFVGPAPIEAVGDYFRSARALIAPSRCYETFGLTVAEAFAHATPAIVTGHGALRELVEESGGGLVVDGQTSLAAAIDRLAGSADEAQEMGQRGRDFVSERFTPERHVGRLLGLVNEVLSERNPS